MSVADPNDLVRRAQEYLAAGNHDAALELFKSAVAADPTCLVALRSIGMLLSLKGLFSEAMEYCAQALNLQPDDLEVVVFMASCSLKLLRLADAASYYRRAISLNPNIALFHENLALTLQNQGMTAGAEEEFRQAIELDPTQALLSYLGLAQILQNRNDLQTAAILCRKVYEIVPDLPMGKYALGQAFLHEGNIVQAEYNLREAIALQPNLQVALRLLGSTLQQSGRFEEAEEFFRKAIELDPNRGSSYVALAMGRKITEQDRPFVEQMESVLRSGQSMGSDQCAIHFAIGKAFNDLGEYESAIKEYDEANILAAQIFLGGRPFDPRAHIALSERVEAIYSRELFEKYRPWGSESDLPLFIVGMMRSGTTLTEHIVSCHPDVAAGGELAYWSEYELGVVDPLLLSLDEQKLKRVQTKYLDLLATKAAGKKHVTNKTPGNYSSLGLIHLAFPRAKLIHCKRDPVDTALSIYMTPDSSPVDFGYVRENIVFGYRMYQRLMDFYKRVLPPDSIIEVQYEDMVADREGTTRRIVDFLGLEWSDECLRPEANQRPVNTPTMWQVRQPIYTAAVKRWKNYEPWLGAFRELMVEP